MPRALHVAVVVLLAAGLAAGGGFAYFALTFGSADHAEFTLTAQRIPADRIAENATDIDDPDVAVVVDRAYRNGSTVAIRRFDVDGAYVERNGSYYRIQIRDTAVTAERPVITIEQVNETDGETVEAENLPRADQPPFILAWRAWTIRNTDRGSGHPPVRGVYETVPDDDESVFVPDQEVRYVRVDNRTFRVRIDRRNVTLDAERYTLERVATSESAFVALLIRNASSRLTGEEAEPLKRAIENGTYVSRASSYEAAWEPLKPIARLCDISTEAFENDGRRATCYVRFDGVFYRLTVDGYHTFA